MTSVASWAGSLVLLAALGLGTALAPGVAHRQPRLVVLLVIDQLRTDYIERFEDRYRGGLGWLLRSGAYFPRAAYSHSATVTSAGQATISTDVQPASHRIVGNSWRERGRLLHAIDQDVGLERALFALSADHGALPLVEHLQENGIPAERFFVERLWRQARRVAEKCVAGPASETGADANGTRLYWDEDALLKRNTDTVEASECVASSLRSQPGVETVLTAQPLSTWAGNSLEALFENALLSGRSPHIQIRLREYLYVGRATGTGHGSPCRYDRGVPVLPAGAGISPGRHDCAASPTDIAPTLAAVLGLAMKAGPANRILEEALQRGSG